jgi:hypothetical protein
MKYFEGPGGLPVEKDEWTESVYLRGEGKDSHSLKASSLMLICPIFDLE